MLNLKETVLLLFTDSIFINTFLSNEHAQVLTVSCYSFAYVQINIS